jgi:hypothetical protein
MPLSQTHRLACPLAQEVQLGPPGLAASHRYDLNYARRIQRKDTLHPLAAHDPANCEHLVNAPTLPCYHRAAERLDTLLIALDDLALDLNGIANLKNGYILLQAFAFNDVQQFRIHLTNLLNLQSRAKNERLAIFFTLATKTALRTAKSHLL